MGIVYKVHPRGRGVEQDNEESDLILTLCRGFDFRSNDGFADSLRLQWQGELLRRTRPSEGGARTDCRRRPSYSRDWIRRVLAGETPPSSITAIDEPRFERVLLIIYAARRFTLAGL